MAIVSMNDLSEKDYIAAARIGAMVDTRGDTEPTLRWMANLIGLWTGDLAGAELDRRRRLEE